MSTMPTEPRTPATRLPSVAAELRRLSDVIDDEGITGPVAVATALRGLAAEVDGIADRVAIDDAEHARHARIVVLARYAVDGNERDLARLLTAEQVRT